MVFTKSVMTGKTDLLITVTLCGKPCSAAKGLEKFSLRSYPLVDASMEITVPLPEWVAPLSPSRSRCTACE